MLDCQSAQEECIAKNKELAQQKLDNITEEFETLTGFAESVKASSEAMVNFYSSAGYNVNGPETMNEMQTQMGLQREISTHIQGEISAYEKELANAAKIFGVSSNEYREAATKLQDMRKALTESNTALYDLRNQVMDLNFKPLDFAMSKLQSFGKNLQNILGLNQKRSIYPSENDYMKQVNNNNAMINTALQQYEMAQSNIINNGLEVNSDEYQKWIQKLRAARDTIIDLRTQNEQLKVDILNSRWKSFEDLHKKIDQTVDDFEWLGKQIKDSQIFDDNGQGWNLTAKGAAAIALLGETMAKHKGNIVDYRQAIKNLQKQLEKNPEMADVLNERIEEYIKKIKDESDALEENKDKLIDYYKTGIQNENEALQKNIQLRSEALSKQKEYNDYAKQLQNQNRDRNKILAQINALQGSSNLQARAEVARLREQLYEADQELSDTRQNHRYDMLSKGFSQLSDDANEALDETLRAVDANSELQQRVVENMLGIIKTNYNDAYSSINNIISETGVKIHDTTQQSVNDLNSATTALGKYEASTIETLKTISSQTANKVDTSKIITDTATANYAESVAVNSDENKIERDAAKKHAEIEAAKAAEAARLSKIESQRQDIYSAIDRLMMEAQNEQNAIEQAKQAQAMLEAEKANKKTSNSGSSGAKKTGVATNVGATKQDNYLSEINSHSQNYDSIMREIDKLREELNSLNSYKRGTLGTLKDELAFTHEGEIIRRSDGAILRQLPAGTQVIPKAASENLLKWAQIDPFKELKEGFKNSSQITNTSNNAPVFYYDSIIHIDGNVDADMMDRVEQLGKALLSSGNFQKGVVQKVTQEYKREFNKRY